MLIIPVLSTSAQVFHPVMSDATNTDAGPNPLINPFAVRSDLGCWIVAGNVLLKRCFLQLRLIASSSNYEDLVSNFWKLDSVPEASLLTSEERSM
ncbi:hypothetical protein TNIN_278151 [Trichonephila inaurata madagascariensis]|uniref:Uncharacterized protein n=1 Tax=Trichonephila inaurata madagascariensis TaxID=2747483 RepID=A0A8X6IJY5_9ARAC|nr:hypothetical protein TNIN_278151 [Trichonephila inaurata madagascariensis]